jgi:hypothetical protein
MLKHQKASISGVTFSDDLEAIYDVEFPTLEHLNGGIAHDEHIQSSTASTSNSIVHINVNKQQQKNKCLQTVQKYIYRDKHES